MCSEYQIAVGIEYSSVEDPGAPSAPYYSGFEMTNGCQLIAQNGLTEDNNQVCNGDWFHGADVTCGFSFFFFFGFYHLDLFSVIPSSSQARDDRKQADNH